METLDVEHFLQGVVVLREFVKELAAIAQAKSNLQGLTDVARAKRKAKIPGIEQADI